MDQESVLSGVRRDRSTGLPSEFGFRKDMGERFENGLPTPGDNERVERETQKRDDESIQGDAQTNSSERGRQNSKWRFSWPKTSYCAAVRLIVERSSEERREKNTLKEIRKENGALVACLWRGQAREP
jgi:hypothetical protein